MKNPVMIKKAILFSAEATWRGMLRFLKANRYTVNFGYNDMDFPWSHIVLSKISLYQKSNNEVIGIIDSIGLNRNKEDIVISRIVITKMHCKHHSASYFVVA